MLFLCFLYLNKVACHIKIQGSSVYMIAIVRDAFFCELCGWLALPALLQNDGYGSQHLQLFFGVS